MERGSARARRIWAHQHWTTLSTRGPPQIGADGFQGIGRSGLGWGGAGGEGPAPSSGGCSRIRSSRSGGTAGVGWRGRHSVPGGANIVSVGTLNAEVRAKAQPGAP